MRSYKEIIDGDRFNVGVSHNVNSKLTKLCWKCEKPNTDGTMVWDVNKMRFIFHCQDCYNKLKN